MKELKNLARLFYVLSKEGDVILTDNIWERTPLNNLEKLTESVVEFKKDTKNWTYGYDPDVGTIIIPKTIGQKLIGEVPKEAKYFFIGEEETISKTKSQSKIIYYKTKNE